MGEIVVEEVIVRLFIAGIFIVGGGWALKKALEPSTIETEQRQGLGEITPLSTPSATAGSLPPFDTAVASVVKGAASQLMGIVGIGKLSREEVVNLAQVTVDVFFPQVDWRMLVAMAQIESSFNTQAARYESHLKQSSLGLMQVLPATAQWMYDIGHKEFEPTEKVLKTAAGSMYFGAAYVNTLRTWRGQGRSEEWVVRGYNGGQGWERGSANSKAMTLNHWQKYQKAKMEI